MLDIIATFPSARRSGDGLMAKCPSHEDRTASLSIGTGDDGRVLLKCHAGCSTDDILDAVHLKLRDLFPQNGNGHRARQIVATYDYKATTGDLLFQVVRYSPKDFRQRRPDGNGGWIPNVKGLDRVVYHLPEIQGQKAIFIAEGEQDADRLASIGLPATTCAGGAQKWRDAYTKQIKDAGVERVVILSDNDEPGRKHAEQVAASCHRAGIDVRIVNLPDVAEKGDVSDYLDAHSKADLTTLMKAAPRYTPTHDAEPTAQTTARTSAEFRPEDPYPQSEAGDAEFFASLVTDHALYDHSQRRWFLFGDHHWRPDPTGQIVQIAIDAMRKRQAIALQMTDFEQRSKSVQRALGGEAEARIRHMLDIAKTHPQLGIDGTAWDQESWLLGVKNGVIDLQTGTLREGRPEDRITKVAAVPYDAEATCPRWEQFILEISNDDAALADFHHRSLGYALTGETSEQCFWIDHGPGGNGKSTYLETVTRYVIPEHSWTMSFPVSSWTESLSEYQRAELVGRRLVIAKESEQQKRLNTEFVKSLTGQDSVNARHPYGRPFAFIPTAKFILACNHQPVIRDDSHGMWRRVRLVPFARTFPLDRDLPDVLAGEAPGILRWAVDGCLAWQKHGLQAPEAVTGATAEYQQESDTVGAFIAACCVELEGVQVRAGTFYGAYDSWCAETRIPEVDRVSARAVGERMKRTYRAITGRHVTYVGIGLKDEDER